MVVVGAGGLGCPALQYLAAAGVGASVSHFVSHTDANDAFEGKIGIIDHDAVEISNLQRQVLHTESRVGMPKVLSAAEAIQQ